MIKLEDISTYYILENIKEKSKQNKNYKYIYSILKEYNITDFQKLKDLLDKKESKLDYKLTTYILNNYLETIAQKINEFELQGKEINIFKFNNYKNTDIDNSTLTLTDNSNNGDILIYSQPTTKVGCRINPIKILSITDLKYLLGHIDCYRMQNSLTRIPKLGVSIANKIANAIIFYEEQIIRQAKETNEKEINLFILNKTAKEEIVKSQLKEIIEYIIDNANECIWGKLSDTQKKKMITIALSQKGEYIQEDKRSLISVISNYTTLTELEQGVVKKRTLDRFIIK